MVASSANVCCASATSRFQSPSLRGSGRFCRRSATSCTTSAGFNPLHCGAVVASLFLVLSLPGEDIVSIPFIAGQWSLRSVRASLRDTIQDVSIPFIAGQWSLQVPPIFLPFFGIVSIPFIAGQWSLPMFPFPFSLPEVPFQSPSLRGSGRFGSIPRSIPGYILAVSIPFIAGQWSLH